MFNVLSLLVQLDWPPSKKKKKERKKSTNVGYRGKSKVGLIMDENNELIIYFAAAAKEDPTPNEYLMSKERYFFGFDSLALSLHFFWLDIWQENYSDIEKNFLKKPLIFSP